MRFLQKESPALLLRNSLLLDEKLAKEAFKASRRNELFYQDRKTYQDQLKMAEKEDKTKKPLEKRSVLILPSRETFQITPKKNFGVLRFLAGPKQAKTYLENLAKKDIDALTFGLPDVSFVDQQEKPFVQQAWFSGDGRCFNDDCRAFGVFENLGFAQKQKISKRENSELYEDAQIKKYEGILQKVRHGNLAPSQLEEIIAFFKSLQRK